MRNYFAPQIFRMGRISAQIFSCILLVFSIIDNSKKMIRSLKYLADFIDKTEQKRYNYNG